MLIPTAAAPEGTRGAKFTRTPEQPVSDIFPALAWVCLTLSSKAKGFGQALGPQHPRELGLWLVLWQKTFTFQ